LSEKINEAVDAQKGVAISSDGSDFLPADNKFWVTPDVMNGLANAIKEAVNALTSGAQWTINSAFESLNSALNEFNAAKKTGTWNIEKALAAVLDNIRRGVPDDNLLAAYKTTPGSRLDIEDVMKIRQAASE
jgi:hypothetical protein